MTESDQWKDRFYKSEFMDKMERYGYDREFLRKQIADDKTWNEIKDKDPLNFAIEYFKAADLSYDSDCLHPRFRAWLAYLVNLEWPKCHSAVARKCYDEYKAKTGITIPPRRVLARAIYEDQVRTSNMFPREYPQYFS